MRRTCARRLWSAPSALGRADFEARRQDQENLLDLLQHAGMAVLWIDNQSGCKGVCDRVPNVSATEVARTAGCSGEGCLDEAMLRGLDERIAALDAQRRSRGIVVVMHQMGSHGPAYYKRSPKNAKPFQPECESSALQHCPREALLTESLTLEETNWLGGQPTITDAAAEARERIGGRDPILPARAVVAQGIDAQDLAQQRAEVLAVAVRITGRPAVAEADRLTAATIRGLAMDGVQAANSGHPGMPLGMADVATVLWTRFLRYDPTDPAWPDRDRFVLSAGHGSMLIYALLHLTGYPGVTLDEIKRFRQLHSKTAGHPEVGITPGVETTTGPLGQGFASAVGMALAEAHLAARYNRPGLQIVDHFTWCLAGDGDLMEGVAAEAASLAGHLGLGKLIALYDDNHITIDGGTF